MDYVDCVNMYVYIYIYIYIYIYYIYVWLNTKLFYKPIPGLLPTANESRFLRNKFLVKLLNNFVTSL